MGRQARTWKRSASAPTAGGWRPKPPWSAQPSRGLLTETIIVSDDAGQFDALTHALCSVHAERHLRRVLCATTEQQRLVDLQRQLVWWFYRDLKLYKVDPNPARRAALRRRFDRIFGRVSGFAELDDAVARIRSNKAELLLALDRPEIPLHTNGSENDLRSVVTKRKISGETRSAAGKRARDAFLSLLKTCAKLGVSFRDCLGARLKIPEADPVPWLPDLIGRRAGAGIAHVRVLLPRRADRGACPAARTSRFPALAA